MMKRELNKSKRVNWLRQYSIALFKGKRGRYTVSIVSVFVISLFVLWMISGWDIRFGEGVLYVNILEPVVTLGTFFIAAWLGARNIKEEWENQLPKKLTVHFKHKDSYVFTCHKAYLFGESDIRQMGQQIGFQMNENHSLSFYPYIKLEPTTIEKNEKEYFRHYEVTFFLSSWEKKGYKVCWDNDLHTPGNREWIFDVQDKIISEEQANAVYEERERTEKKLGKSL
ncbi:hypothetical protein C3V43_11255 [Bacteroides heparinolyticus]|uniref:hypothetical protein n=1 Tax=Bacteroides TaxID=816 RepID=UPI000D0289F4|nr:MULTISPECIES: hypothetical protein [Bacteroides]AVM58264.1 hypothetical protein C3V43_11255 [Bacteroides heparinolyticus]